MGEPIDGTYSIRQVLLITKQHWNTRYEYKDRDVLKKIYVKKIVKLDPSKKGEPSVRYEVRTFSYPNYKPYWEGTDKRGRSTKYQRHVKHEYDLIFTIDVMTVDTINWKMRVGSGKKVIDAPDDAIATISKKLRDKWKSEQTKLLAKANNPKKKEKAKNYLKEQEEKHKKRAKYLDAGDWLSRVLGINLDFTYRFAFTYKYHNHLYGKWYYPLDRPSKINPDSIIGFTKHQLMLIEVLLQKGILKV